MYLAIIGCSPDPEFIAVEDNASIPAIVNQNHTKREALQAVLDEFTQKGIPGLSALVRTADGEIWMGSSGFSQIENNQKMQPMQRMYSASIGKSFCAMATAILAQNNQIDLDLPIATYLPNHLKNFQNTSSATVRQVLGHQGGFTNLDDNPKFISDVLNNSFSLTTTGLLGYEEDKQPYADAGKKHHYSSTGYELLAALVEEVTGDHVQFYKDEIFIPLGLESAMYHSEVMENSPTDLVNSYWDRFDNKKLENVSNLNNFLTSIFTGSDGVVATVYDYYQLLNAFVEGTFLSSEIREEVLTFIATGSKTTIGYGLGLQQRTSDFGNRFGHDGDAIGAGADMWYFPDQDVYVVATTNLGTVLEGELSDMYNKDFLNKLFKTAIQ